MSIPWEGIDPQIVGYIKKINKNNPVFKTMFSCYGHYRNEHKDFPGESKPYILIKFYKRENFVNFLQDHSKHFMNLFPWLGVDLANFDKKINKHAYHDNCIGFDSREVKHRDIFWKTITKELLLLKNKLQEGFSIRNYIIESTEPYRELFIDMDGVLTDFRKAFVEKTGKDIERTDRFWTYLANDKYFWAEMEWLPEGKRLWEKLKHLSPTILSSPTKDPSCIKGKNLWIDKHLGRHVPRIFESDKWKYSKEGNILIDDMEKNIVPWVQQGGTGILFDGREKVERQVDLTLFH